MKKVKVVCILILLVIISCKKRTSNESKDASKPEDISAVLQLDSRDHKKDTTDTDQQLLTQSKIEGEIGTVNREIDSRDHKGATVDTDQKLLTRSKIEGEIRTVNREIDYQTILTMVLKDKGNFRLIIPENPSKPQPNEILVNRKTKRWHKKRFCVSALDSIEYFQNTEGHFNYPFNVHYIFRKEMVNLIHQREKEALESFATNIPPETISVENPNSVSLADSNTSSANAIHVQFSKPVYSKNREYLFVDYTMFYNDHIGETSFSSPIYSYNFIIFRNLGDNNLEKVKHDDYLFY